MTSQFSKLPRCAFSALVLLGAVTTVFACTAGGNDTKEETVGVTEQGLNWAGGCACMPVEECPTVTGSLNSVCKYPASQGQDACIGLLECKPGEVACFIREDGKECTIGGPVGKCDGGHCGTCPSCYYESPKGVCAADNKEAVCGETGATCKNDCRDSNECTKDTCIDSSACSYDKRDGMPCTKGTCLGDACCTGCNLNGACEEGFKETACGTGGAECKICDDGNPCTTDYCDGTGCRTVPVTVGTSCADSNRCNGTETCNGSGVCRPGTAVICTVTDPCFSYACNPATGACDRTPLTGPTCSDGSVCTETDTCQSGVCVGTGTKNCSDGNDCTDDACDAVLGCQHSKLADGHSCDDGGACTVGETCQNGTCTSTGGVACNDNNPCTVDTYDCVNTKCVYTPSNEGERCLSDNLCLANTVCKSGVCQGGTALSCDDYNPCTDDSCSSTTGGCLHPPAVTAGPCSDNNPCTENDQCNAMGSCTGTIRVCPPLDECHLSGTCNLTSGACENDPRKPDGASCAQGNGACSGGVCLLTSGTGGTSAGGASGIGGIGQGGIGGIGQGGSGGTNSAATSATGGAPSSGGAATGGTNDAGGKSSGQSSVADAGAAGSDGDDTGDLYQRNPGGCSCSLPARDSRGWGWLLSLLAVASILRFRQRKN